MNPIPLPKKANTRSDAAWLLYQVLEHGRSLRDCMPKIQSRHNTRDNAWIQEMTRGTLRQLPILQYWLRQLLDKPLKGNKKILEHLLMLGLYQLAYSRVSTHAAVGETVGAATLLGGQNLKGLLNAVLRNFVRQEMQSQLPDDAQLRSGLPKWLYKAVNAHYPDQLDAVIEQMNQPGPVWLRVNQKVLTRQTYIEHLDKAGIAYELPPEQSDGIILQQRLDVTQLPGFSEGWFAVQDGAAQLAAQYLDTQAGDRVLDCCAAPGGKTGHIMERTPEIAQCIALDSDAKRMQRTAENMQRLTHAPKLITADASDLDAWWDGQPFDRILLDAPCSATGVIRRHPDIRWLRRASDIDALVSIQAELLEKLWSTLKPGGTLLYATCSILPQENRQQIAQFLAHHSDASLHTLSESETPECPGRQILPGEQQMDGFYYARLLKS